MKNKYFLIFALTVLTSLGVSQKTNAECLGKIELAPAYIHIDVIESRNTIKELDMAGIRGDLSLAFGRGWLIKPFGIYGKEKDGEIASVSLGIGRCIPIGERWIVSPTVGVNYTTMGTSICLDLGELGELRFKDRFSAVAPYASIELTFKLACNWRVCGSFQYSWSHATTKVKELFTSKSDAEGPSYGLQLEYDLNQQWSVNVGAAYNESFSREKNGLRARGGKIGIARWF